MRILLALLLATGCHLLLLLLPFPQSASPPLLTGRDGIEISLQSTPRTPDQQKKTLPEPVKSNPPPPAETGEEKSAKPITLRATMAKKHHPIPRKQGTSRDPDPSRAGRKQQESASQTSTDNFSAPQHAAIVKAAPLYHRNQTPEYPSLARRRNWEGTVILSVLVSREGAVKKIRVQRGSGHSLLDNSALKTVKSWIFIPGTENGVVAETMILVPVHFRLEHP